MVAVFVIGKLFLLMYSMMIEVLLLRSERLSLLRAGRYSQFNVFRNSEVRAPTAHPRWVRGPKGAGGGIPYPRRP